MERYDTFMLSSSKCLNKQQIPTETHPRVLDAVIVQTASYVLVSLTLGNSWNIKNTWAAYSEPQDT